MASSSCFTVKIDLSLAQKLQSDLETQGFTLSKPPYTLFAAKKKGVACTLYESGKLTVQGKEMRPFIEFYLEPEILKAFYYTNPQAHLDLTPRIGMDEAGKGDFFGPLCVAALYADREKIPQLSEMGAKDSKRFSDEKILKMAKSLRANFPYTVIRLFPQKYNELIAKFKNLNRLLAWAHAAALTDLTQKTSCSEAILDQFADPSLVENFLKQKKVEIHLVQKVRAEEDLVVAAASILARAAFLEGLELLQEEFGLSFPKGASQQVVKTAATFVAKFGKERLRRVAKTHFKTMEQL